MPDPFDPLTGPQAASLQPGDVVVLARPSGALGVPGEALGAPVSLFGVGNFWAPQPVVTVGTVGASIPLPTLPLARCAMRCTGAIVTQNTVTGDTATLDFATVVKRISASATVAVVGTFVALSEPLSDEALWTLPLPTVAVTNGVAAVSLVGLVGLSIEWVPACEYWIVQ